MKRNVLNSPRLLELKKKRRRVFLGKFLLSLFGLVVIFTGLTYLSRMPALNIRDVEIAGNKVADAEVMKATIQKEITGNYLWFFPKTNLLFYPKNSIKKKLSNQFTRLEDINLYIKNNRILEVSVTEREALYTWCGNDLVVGLPSEAKCYFMDEEGYIFDEAPYFSGDVYFKFFGGVDLKDGVPLGANFVPLDFNKFISFKDSLLTMGLKPVGLYKEENGDVKVFLAGKTELAGPEIMFKADTDLKNLLENLQTALATEPLLFNFKNKYSSLLYIDLRYGNKVYYKFK